MAAELRRQLSEGVREVHEIWRPEMLDILPSHRGETKGAEDALGIMQRLGATGRSTDGGLPDATPMTSMHASVRVQVAQLFLFTASSLSAIGPLHITRGHNETKIMLGLSRHAHFDTLNRTTTRTFRL